MNPELVKQAAINIEDMLKYSLKLEPTNKVLVIYDTNYELTNILTEGYRIALDKFESDTIFYDFDVIVKDGKDKIIALFDELKPGDLVVQIQSGSFRLDDFRIRIYLFSKKLKVIEHLHLTRDDHEVFDVYIDSLKYDESERLWYKNMKNKLVDGLPSASSLEFKAFDATLRVGAVEVPKINVGDYTDMDNVGGTFPIGEVFTEARNLETMNGSIYIYGFANREFNLSYYEPFRIDIKNGLIVGYGENTPQEFVEILQLVKNSERPLIREIGFGLNRAMTRERPLGDITAYERILGIHMSLGEKHTVYKKEGIIVHKTRFHVDLFLCIDEVNMISGEKVENIMDKNGYRV